MTAIFIKTKNVTGVGSPKQASEGADPDLHPGSSRVIQGHPDPEIRGGPASKKIFLGPSGLILVEKWGGGGVAPLGPSPSQHY